MFKHLKLSLLLTSIFLTACNNISSDCQKYQKAMAKTNDLEKEMLQDPEYSKLRSKAIGAMGDEDPSDNLTEDEKIARKKIEVRFDEQKLKAYQSITVTNARFHEESSNLVKQATDLIALKKELIAASELPSRDIEKIRLLQESETNTGFKILSSLNKINTRCSNKSW